RALDPGAHLRLDGTHPPPARPHLPGPSPTARAGADDRPASRGRARAPLVDAPRARGDERDARAEAAGGAPARAHRAWCTGEADRRWDLAARASGDDCCVTKPAGVISLPSPLPTEVPMTTTSVLPDVGIELREGYAEVGDDLNLHYVEAGDGPLI